MAASLFSAIYPDAKRSAAASRAADVRAARKAFVARLEAAYRAEYRRVAPSEVRAAFVARAKAEVV